MPRIPSQVTPRCLAWLYSGICLLAGSASVLGFSPYNKWYAPIIGIAWLIWLTQRTSTKQASLYAWIWGLGFYSVGINWIYISISEHSATPTALALGLTGILVAGMALFPALFGYLSARIARYPLGWRILVIPALWLFTEWIKEWLFTGFPWINMGYSQLFGPFHSLIPVGGSTLLTLITLYCATLVQLAISGTPRQRMAALGIGAIPCLASLWMAQQTFVTKQQDSQLISIVQGNVPQDDRWLITEREHTLYRYLDMSDDLWDHDVLIWPEAAIPAVPQEIPGYLNYLTQRSTGEGVAFITGIPTMTDDYTFYNAVMTFGGASGIYYKHHLVPFGEYVPFENALRTLNSIFNLPMSSFQRGDLVQPPLQVGKLRYAVALCYEIAYPAQVWRNFQQADTILTLSNDAWFGDSKGPHQHLQMAQFRAIELGRPVIRSTNNGITAIILPDATIAKQLPQFEQSVLSYRLYHYTGKTPYQIWGPYLAYSIALGILLLFAGYACTISVQQKAGITAKEPLESA